ncbi:MAG: hypothetical protein WD981_06525 [Gaiellaceae bacterium]
MKKKDLKKQVRDYLRERQPEYDERTRQLQAAIERARQRADEAERRHSS